MKINFSSEILGIENFRHRQKNAERGKNYTRQHSISADAQNYNKPAGQNSCGFVNFKGSPTKLIAESAEEIIEQVPKDSRLARWGLGLVEKKGFNKTVQYALEHEAMFNALISLGIVSTIRPLITLSMPIKNDKDKVAVAAKEVVGGIIGYGLATAILKPINVPVTKIIKNYQKYIKNDPDLLENLTNKSYSDAFSSFWKNIPETILAPMKGVITVAMMPVVIAMIDKMRGEKKHIPTKEEIDLTTAVNSSCNRASEDKAFSKIAATTSFKGGGAVQKEASGFFQKLSDHITDKMAHGIAAIAKTKPAKATVEGINHFTNPSMVMQQLASVVYTFTLMQKTAKSKKIKKEQKPMLILNAALVTAVSSALSILVDKKTDPILDKMYNAYVKLDSEKKLKIPDQDYLTGLKKTKSFTVFTTIVRFIVPVVMVPVSSAIIEKIKNNKAKKELEEDKAKQV